MFKFLINPFYYELLLMLSQPIIAFTGYIFELIVELVTKSVKSLFNVNVNDPLNDWLNPLSFIPIYIPEPDIWTYT